MMRCASRVLFAVALGVALMIATAPVQAVTLVRDGKPTSLIVTGNNPNPVQQVAAEQLQYHLQKMTGATVPIVAESDLDDSDQARIYVGPSEHLQQLGVDFASLNAETFIARTIDNALVLVGDDAGSRQGREFHDADARAGTLYAVYDFLQDELGCRWVWPGPTGEVIPQRDTVSVEDLDVQETPQLIRRHFRAGLRPQARETAWRHFPRYMRDKLDAMYEPLMLDEQFWLRRMRMGESDKPAYGHAFTRWYERYHDEHPEIFALQPDGHRGLPNDSYPASFVKMCPSSDKLVDMLIEQFQEARERNPNHRWLNACENDGGLGFCVCDECRALDVKPTDEVRAKLHARGWSDEQIDHEFLPGENGLPRALSNRYFHFYNKLARRLAEVAPDAYVVAYAYTNYQYAPVDMQLEPNILLGLIGFNMYPMTEDYHEREIKNLQAWTDSGIEALFFRPNSFYFSVGHGVPWDATKQMAGDMKMLLDGGILSTDFDRLNGHWSTAARSYYVLARQHWDTDLDVPTLEREFAEAFGPAADAIQRYFDHWEQVFHEAYTRDDLDEIANQVDEFGGRIGQRKALAVLVPQEQFDRGREILADARSAAEQAGDEALLTRIRVLELGLRHGELMREGTKYTVERSYTKPRYYQEHWPVVQEAHAVREQLGELRAHNVYWLNNFELRAHDAYGMRVYHDFYNRPYTPIMSPARVGWQFVPDPTDVGESESWYSQTLEGLEPFEWPQYRHLFYAPWDEFGPVRAWKRQTGEKAVRNGWYQISFAIPAKDLSQDAVLYFPYIKGDAKIWIGDRLVREVSAEEGAADDAVVIKPADVGIQPDQPFRLTVKVSSPEEPGGLIGPVYLAQPTSR